MQNENRPPTIADALAALERHVGFDSRTTRGIARSLQESDVLQTGAPGVAPSITPEEFAKLFVAIAAGKPRYRSSDVAREYLAATPGGISLTNAPTSVHSARTALLALIDTALKAPSDLRGLTIEVVNNWVEIAVHSGPDHVERFIDRGVVEGHWNANHRRATSVSGSAFAAAVRETFKDLTCLS